MKIKIDELSKVVQEELDTYAEEVGEAVDNAVLRVAKRCLATIRQNSPVQSGEYRKGWAMKRERARARLVATIYNRKRWFLIHLLEDGHQKARGGRVPGKPHVEPAFKQADRELETEIIKELGG